MGGSGFWTEPEVGFLLGLGLDSVLTRGGPEFPHQENKEVVLDSPWVVTRSAVPGNLLEMQILRLHPGPTDLETLEEGTSSLCFNKFSW